MADITDSLTGANRDAAKALVELFKQYGLESLAPKIVEFIQNGYSADTTAILLQDTTEYKQRFAANEARRKKGLPVLSPAVKKIIACDKPFGTRLLCLRAWSRRASNTCLSH